jgi:hypothetical protein
MTLGVKKMIGNRRVRTTVLSTLILTPLCSIVAACLFLSGCQEEAKIAKSPATPVIDSNTTAPRITFDETIHDFGDVVPETKHATRFTFKNTGTAPLKIINVRPCCGAVTKGVEEGQVYAPGRGGAVELEYPAGTLPGSVLRYIYITTNDPAQEITTLTFKAEIVAQISCEPVNLRLFLRRENGGAGDLTVTSLTKQPFSITAFRSTADAITTKFDPAAKDTKFVLKLAADLEKLKQHPRGRLEIVMTHPGCKSTFVDYDVLPEFTVSPPQIMAFNLKPGEAIQKEIWVLGNYDNDFEIESVTSKNGTIKLVNKEKVKASAGPVVGLPIGEANRPRGDQYQYRLRLEIMPPQDRANMRDTLLIAIKGGDTLTAEYAGFFAAN